MKKNNMNGKPSIKSATALLFSFLLLFPVNVASATVGTVSGNETVGEEAVVTVSENQSSEREELEDTVSEQSFSEMQAGTESPANPVHHCKKYDDAEYIDFSDDTDYTDFSYVYFGSYPQSEVTDSAVITAIDKELEKYGTIADAGMDVWLNGTKYRRISIDDTNCRDYFNDMPASNGYRYFKWEQVKWKVLQNDGNTLFVVADKVIDCKHYNEEEKRITWENSTIRDWLNASFYNTAFSSNEQSAIVEQNVVNEDNPSNGTEGGNDTRDKVYLLSISEATNEAYGFCSEYITYSRSRRIKESDYARARGTWRADSDSPWEGNCWWWLRSPGTGSCDVAHVSPYGHVAMGGGVVGSSSDGVCPALHIKLSSDTWSIAYAENGDEAGSNNNNTGNTQENGNDNNIKVQKLSITAPSKKLAAGKKVKLTLDVIPQNATNQAIKWETNNKKYATVDKNGLITLKKKGIGKDVTITATAQDGSGKKAAIKVKIMRHAVKSIKLTAPKKTLKAGKGMTIKTAIKTTGKDANKAVIWKSSNKKYATVSRKGKVTAKKAGKGKSVTITATSTDGSNKKAKIKIKIR